MAKYTGEISLTEQAFVKDPDMKVGALLKSKNASVNSFVRLQVGEGIEKEVVDFASEVAAQVAAAKN
jgi:elongation factor Ts